MGPNFSEYPVPYVHLHSDSIIYLWFAFSSWAVRSLPTNVSQRHRASILSSGWRGEIAAARQADPALQLVLGHGSGSFGHLHARQYGTRDGVHSADEWFGFALTADAATRLTKLVVRELLDAGVPVGHSAQRDRRVC